MSLIFHTYSLMCNGGCAAPLSPITFCSMRVLVKGLAAMKFDMEVIDDTVWAASPSVLVPR